MIKNNKKFNLLMPLFALAVFLLPLERLGSIGYASINIRMSQILVLLIFCVYFISGFLKKKIEIRFSKPLVFYICFLLVCLISLIGANEKMRGLIISLFLGFMILVPFVTVIVIDNKNKLNAIVKVLLLSAAFFSLFGLFQFFGDIFGIPSSITGLSNRYIGEVLGFPRIQSTFIEPLYFANYLIIPLMVSVLLVLRRKNSRKDLFILIGLAILFLFTMILTFSKGALASLAIIFVGILFFQFRSVFSRKNIIYLLFSVVFIVIASWVTFSVFQAQPDSGKIYKKASEIIMGGSIVERQEAYSVALDAYQANPVIGIGIGNFGPYFSGYPTSAPDFGWPIANNEYLEILSETGIVGLSVFLLFLLSIFYYSYIALRKTEDRELKTFLLAFNFAFIGILIQYLTFSTLYIMHIWVLIGLILAVQGIILKQGK